MPFIIPGYYSRLAFKCNDTLLESLKTHQQTGKMVIKKKKIKVNPDLLEKEKHFDIFTIDIYQ